MARSGHFRKLGLNDRPILRPIGGEGETPQLTIATSSVLPSRVAARRRCYRAPVKEEQIIGPLQGKDALSVATSGRAQA
jgi:hypothetical protein